MNNTESLKKTINTIMTSQNTQLRQVAEKRLKESFNLDINTHIKMANFLSDPKNTISEKKMIIIHLKSFFEMEKVFKEENKIYEKYLELYSQLYYKLENDLNFLNNFIDVLLSILGTEPSFELLSKFNVFIWNGVDLNDSFMTLRSFFLMRYFYSKQKVLLESCQFFGNEFVEKFLGIGEFYLNLMVSFVGPEFHLKVKKVNFDILFLYLKIGNICFKKKIFEIDANFERFLGITKKVLKINFYGNESLDSNYNLTVKSDFPELECILQKSKTKILKLLNFFFLEKAGFKKQKKNFLEFLIRSLQNFLFKKNTKINKTEDKLISICLTFIKNNLSTLDFYEFFDINKKNIFQFIIKKIIFLKSLNFLKKSEDYEDQILADLDDCLNLYKNIDNSLTYSIELFVEMNNIIENFPELVTENLLANLKENLQKENNSNFLEMENLKNLSVNQILGSVEGNEGLKSSLEIHVSLLLINSLHNISTFSLKMAKDYFIFFKNFSEKLFCIENELVKVDLLHTFEFHSSTFFELDFNDDEKKSLFENFLKFIILTCEGNKKLSFYQCINLIGNFCGTDFLEKSYFVENQIKSYSQEFFKKLIELSYSNKDLNFIKNTNTFYNNFYKNFDFFKIIEILPNLKTALILFAKSQTDLFLTYFGIFQDIMTTIKFSKDQLEEIHLLFFETYNFIYDQQIKDIVEDTILLGLTKIINFQKSTFSQFPPILNNFEKGIEKNNIQIYYTFTKSNIKHSNLSENQIDFILYISSKFIKQKESIYILIFLTQYQKPNFTLKNLQNLHKIILPHYQTMKNNKQKGYKTSIILLYLNIIIQFGQLDFFDNKIDLVLEIVNLYCISENNIFFSQFERKTAVIGVISVVMNLKFLNFFKDKLKKILICCFDHLNIMDKLNRERDGRKILKTKITLCAKKSKNKNYLSSSEEEFFLKNDEESFGEPIFKNFFMKGFEIPEFYPDCSILFKNLVLELQKNLEFYEKILEDLPFFYKEKIGEYVNIEKVVVDEEKGITVNRKIFKIKRKKKN